MKLKMRRKDVSSMLGSSILTVHWIHFGEGGDENTCWSCVKHIVTTAAVESHNLTEGDTVVVYADDQPRSCWRLERIDQVIVGVDGQKREATDRVSKNGRTSTLDRPI